MTVVNVNVAVADGGGGSHSAAGSGSSGIFNVDYDKINDLKKILETDTFETTDNAIEGIYTNVDEMKNGWSGNGYDTYSSSLNDYRKYLETFQFFLLAYANILGSVMTDVVSLNKQINNFLDLK